MKKLMHLLFLSCLKATGLIEKKMLFRLSPSETLQLKIHTMMCSACTHYEKQSALLNHLISKMTQTGPADSYLTGLKEEIKQKLQDHNPH